MRAILLCCPSYTLFFSCWIWSAFDACTSKFITPLIRSFLIVSASFSPVFGHIEHLFMRHCWRTCLLQGLYSWSPVYPGGNCLFRQKMWLCYPTCHTVWWQSEASSTPSMIVDRSLHASYSTTSESFSADLLSCGWSGRRSWNTANLMDDRLSAPSLNQHTAFAT